MHAQGVVQQHCVPTKKGYEKVLGRVLGTGSQKGSEKGAFVYGFYSKNGFGKGSQKGF